MRFRALLCAAALVGLSSSVWAASWEEIVNAGSQSRDWLNYGGDLGQMRFVPSDQINSGNVGDLDVAWIFHTGDLSEWSETSHATNYQVTPILRNDKLYLCTPLNNVIA